ncbi:hypothetical protein ACLVWU_11505 [Bdellovibrio sp. HCB290]|uniref:hypothetical protein n=1 Tax=Bdellovibrio sp. HCB290 TaxID=3394356 RepID=UPI0039B6DCBF
MTKCSISLLAVSILFSSAALAAVPQYKVNMRVGLKGAAPISINTVAKSGKKAYISEFSDDGQSETIVEMMARKSKQNSKDGLYVDVTVTKRVRGQKKISERTQVFAPNNQETEFGMNSKGRMTGNMSLAVMAHQL